MKIKRARKHYRKRDASERSLTFRRWARKTLVFNGKDRPLGKLARILRPEGG